MKHLFFPLGSLFLPSSALAADAPATYTLMAPLAGYLTGSPDLTTYLQGVVQVAIGLAGILAVVMVIYCGIKLIGTPSASAKSEAKECIWNAVFGVLLAIGAWIFLFTINPLLLTNELNLTNVQVAPAATTPGTPGEDPYPTKPGWYFKYSDATGIHYNPSGNSAQMCAALLGTAESAGKTIVPLPDGRKCFEVTSASMSSSEATARTALCGNTSCVGSTPISINNGACRFVGDTGCTNVDGLPSSVIGLLPSDTVGIVKQLATACGCNIVVSGGTEYWLHKSHLAGQPIFDLGLSISSFLNANGTGKRASFVNYRVYWQGFWFTQEGNHWHVCSATLPAWYCRNCSTSACTVQVAETTALIN